MMNGFMEIGWIFWILIFGAIITSLIMELTLFPAIFYIIKKREIKNLVPNELNQKNEG